MYSPVPGLSETAVWQKWEILTIGHELCCFPTASLPLVHGDLVHALIGCVFVLEPALWPHQGSH